MKKYNFFKAICLPCIILSTISCGNEDYFIETSELQLNAMPFAEANIDTTKFSIIFEIYKLSNNEKRNIFTKNALAVMPSITLYSL